MCVWEYVYVESLETALDVVVKAKSAMQLERKYGSDIQLELT